MTDADAPAPTVLALDIGGTKFAAATITADRSVIDRCEVAVGPDPTATLGFLLRRFSGTRLLGVGIGSAGPLDVAKGTVSPLNIPAWRGFPIAAFAGELLGGVPVELAGDAQCMALGEYWHRSCRSLLGVVVSTGVGGGIVVDGELQLGRTGNAGHIGHITVDRAGEACPCGGRGCVETIASGPSMVRWARAIGWVGADAKALADDARRGDPVALQAFDRGAEALGIGIVTTAALLDLDTVVIGGGVAAAGDVLFEPLRMAVARYSALAYLRDLRVVPTALDRDAGLFGAAAIALAKAGAAV